MQAQYAIELQAATLSGPPVASEVWYRVPLTPSPSASVLSSPMNKGSPYPHFCKLHVCRFSQRILYSVGGFCFLIQLELWKGSHLKAYQQATLQAVTRVAWLGSDFCGGVRCRFYPTEITLAHIKIYGRYIRFGGFQGLIFMRERHKLQV